MSIPQTVIWEITRKCNFNCGHCIVDASHDKPEGEMDEKEAKEFISRFAKAGGKSIMFSGGEPLLRKDLESIMEYGKSFGFNSYSIACNGSLVTLERLKSLMAAGLDNLQISLDGVTAEANASIRPIGVKIFNRVIESIKLASSLPIMFSTGMFLHPQNIDSIPRMVELLSSMDVPILRFSGFIPLGRGGKPEIVEMMKFTEEQMYRFFRFLSEYDPSKTGVNLSFDHAFGPFRDYHVCSAGKEAFYMSSEGNVYPCPSFLHPSKMAGSVKNESLENLLNSPKMKNCRVKADEITGPCSECRDLAWCLGGCRGVANAVTEKDNASFPNCLRSVMRNFAAAFEEISEPPTIEEMKKDYDRFGRSLQNRFRRKFSSQASKGVNVKKSSLYGSAESAKKIVNPASGRKRKKEFTWDKYYKAHAANYQKTVENHYLNYLLWEATKNCNFNCRHCSSPREEWQKEKEMTTEQVKEVFAKFAADYDPRRFHALGITGGEPTLRKDLPEIVSYLNNLGFLPALDSNGFTLGRNTGLITELEKAGLKSICISLDGLREEQKAFRGVDSFDPAIKALKFIVRNCRTTSAQTITMVTEYNYDSLDEIFKVIEKTGVRYARFGTVMAIGRAVNDEKAFLSPEKTKELLKWITQKRVDFQAGKTTLLAEFTDNGWCGRADRGGYEGLIRSSQFACTAGISMGIITYDGKFGGCLSVHPSLNIQGDLLREDPKEVWDNRFEVFRDKNRLHTGICIDCKEWDNCLGGGFHERDENRRIKSCTWRKIKVES